MRRVLLVKLGAIGDAVMLLPAAHALWQKGFRVEWMCGASVAPLLRLYPWIEPIVVDEPTFLRGSTGARIGELLRIWPHIWSSFFGASYDLIATVYYDPRYRLLTLPARARRRVQLSHTARAGRLLPGRHHTDEFARILLGWPDDVRPLPLTPVPPPVLPASPRPRSGDRRRVLLVPGGARNLLRDDALRRWPTENYVEVARGLIDEGCEVLLSGGADDRWVSPTFADVAVENCIGELSLVETLGLMHDCDVVVTHDTGPLHLAGLSSAAIVSIFGPTDPRGRLPQRAGTLALWGGEGFACRPCYDGQAYAACHHNACMEQVSPAMVLAEIQQVLIAKEQGAALGPPRVITPESTVATVDGRKGKDQ